MPQSLLELETTSSAATNLIEVPSMIRHIQSERIVARIAFRVISVREFGDVCWRRRDIIATANVVLGSDMHESKRSGR